MHKYAFLDGYPRNYRYPYEFRIAGATPSGLRARLRQAGRPVGGRWHSNGGGWVDNRANVAATAYVGPRAAVFGNGTVRDNARIEGLAWVNSGATVGGNAVVKDNAIVQGGANLGGSVVVGGDAEMAHRLQRRHLPDVQPEPRLRRRRRRGRHQPAARHVHRRRAGHHRHDTAADHDRPPPPTTPTTTPRRRPRRRRPPRRRPPTSTTTSRPPTTTTTTAAPAGRTCTATYRIVGSWQGGFQGEVSVQAGSSAITGWTVTWTFANGQAVTQAWGAALTSSGATVTARNETWNGALGANAATTFGFLANAGATNAAPAPSCTAT